MHLFANRGTSWHHQSFHTFSAFVGHHCQTLAPRPTHPASFNLDTGIPGPRAESWPTPTVCRIVACHRCWVATLVVFGCLARVLPEFRTTSGCLFARRRIEGYCFACSAHPQSLQGLLYSKELNVLFCYYSVLYLWYK